MSKKVIVVYCSKTGFTKKYAEWIAEEIDSDLIEASKLRINDLIKYETIVYGGALYAKGINGLKLFLKKIEEMKDKKLIVFFLGATPLHEGIKEEVINSNFSKEQQESIKFFMLRGGFNFNCLNIMDKFAMFLLKLKLETKKNLTPDEKGMLSSYSRPIDFTDKKYIIPIVNEIRNGIIKDNYNKEVIFYD